MSSRYFAAIVVSFIALAYFKVDVSANTEKDLWRHLFETQEYDARFRPVKDPKTAVQVTVGLSPVSMEVLQSVQPVNHVHPFLKLESWLVVKWKDEYLTWDPKKFDNIEQLSIPVSNVWSPNLFLYPGNSGLTNDSSFLTPMTSNVAIRFDGELMWMSPNSVVRLCFTTTEPGESLAINRCIFSIISWTYDVSQMNIDIDVNVNATATDISVKTLKELKNFSWSKQPYPILHYTFERHV